MRLPMTLLMAGLLWGAPALADDTPADDTQKSPRTLRPEEYGRWESLGFRSTLSDDGRWLAYSIRRVNGENELRLRLLAADAEESFPHGSSPTFSKDGKWLGFLTGVSQAEREKLQKSEKPVRNKLGLHDLVMGKTTEIENVASFTFSDDGAFVVMRRYPLKGKKSKGVDIVVRDLAQGLDTNLGNVATYRWHDELPILAMIVDAEDSAGNGVRTYDPSSGRLRTLHSSSRTYLGMSWREDADDLAVMQDTEHGKDEDPTHVVHTWRGVGSDAVRHRAYDPQQDETFPEGHRVVDVAGLRWSDDGQAVFFGIQKWEKPPRPKDEKQDGDAPTEAKEAKAPEKKKPRTKVDIFSRPEGKAEDDPGQGEKGKKSKEKQKKSDPQSLRDSLTDPSGVEVWHARDVDIIPQQKKTAGRDRRRSHLCAWWIDEDKFVRLADEKLERVALLEGQRRAIGFDGKRHEEEKKFGPNLSDLYVVDTTSGERHRFIERNKFRYQGCPDGSHCLYIKDGHYWSYDLDTGRHRNLTKDLPTSFINDESGHLTDEPRPYGLDSWTEDSTHVLLNDRFDIWLVAVDGSGGRRLTRGAEDEIRHRRQVLDREAEEHLDITKPFLLSLYGNRTKMSGYARLRVGETPERLVWKASSVGRLVKAEEADVYAYVEQAFDDSPDVFVADATLAGPRQVTRTNPFQKDYLWGHGELVDYESDGGVPLQGALIYPANYEPGQEYPMIVDIYEKRSQGLHRYSSPSERSAYNTTVFTQEGYFVFLPDIVYRPQNPGLSAVECVVPAVKAAIATGKIDPDRIGLVGHSWGAYQTAFIVTQTDLFAAGIAGAPLTNMMSMSMSIYWNSGSTNASIFHESQGRMDRPFWQDVDTYIKNSPIFNIDDLNTPLLVAFGDDDGAVDFNQGVEMYNAARLAGKQFVLLVYPGENHGLRQKPNQVDYHYRILEWFGHYLKGDEAQSWITEGQPFLERQKEIEAMKKKAGGGPGRGGGPGPGAGRRGPRTGS